MAAATIGCFFLRPLCVPIARCHYRIPIIRRPSFTSLTSCSSVTSPESASLSITKSFINDDNSHFLSLLAKDLDEQVDEFEGSESNGDENSEVSSAEDSVLKVGESSKTKLPNLTVKEKKELASYAHGLGEKLKCQLVGKSGVTANVVSSFIETLEANELLKIKIHRTCPGEMEDVVKQLEEATGSVVVGQIGRTVIIYRPSLTKMKVEEKKKQARRVSRKSEKPAFLKKGQEARSSGRGRRGSSRF
ncbi:hypothetical protein SLEP1_g31095 [Rubroshorea leprosula]|uniref:CRM domain-containing protein n=1 Tax=Rubroshorea leprosula TaxID=152421 RepID=A0AAV5K9Y0_9ROSI|nr:hypothetical protein SLEP1_g31095 [Rubroshorea leprosula]